MLYPGFRPYHWLAAVMIVAVVLLLQMIFCSIHPQSLSTIPAKPEAVVPIL